MKYDLRVIMKKAWEIKKQNNENIFALCLQMAWALAKENVKGDKKMAEQKMCEITIGSPKQIAWANDIREEYNKVVNQYFKVKNDFNSEIKLENTLTGVITSYLNQLSNAKTWINIKVSSKAWKEELYSLRTFREDYSFDINALYVFLKEETNDDVTSYVKAYKKRLKEEKGLKLKYI